MRVRTTPPVARLILIVLLCVVATGAVIQLSPHLLNYVRQEFGEQAENRLRQWQSLETMAANAPVNRQLALVNSFFNRAKFVSDLKHWGEEDYWATPVELLTTDGGDCEDFSIAKYLTLTAMGVPEDQLRITYVKALRLNQAHMVLAWYPTPDADPLILDNLINDIKPASQRTDLEPVYSFNGKGLWLNKRNGTAAQIGTAERLDHWQAMNERLMKSLK